MRAKTALLFIFFTTLFIDSSTAWGWVKPVVQHAAKLWDRNKKQPVMHIAKTWWSEVKKLRQMDDEIYEIFAAKLEQDISADSDERETRAILSELDEIKHLSDEEFQKLEALAFADVDDEEQGNADGNLEFLHEQMMTD